MAHTWYIWCYIDRNTRRINYFIFVLYYFLLHLFLFVWYCFVLYNLVLLHFIFHIFIDTIFKFLRLFHMYAFLITNFPNITFLSSRVWQNFSSSSKHFDVPLSLVAFRASVIISVAVYSNMMNSSGLIFLVIFCPCALANQVSGRSPIPEPVLHS